MAVSYTLKTVSDFASAHSLRDYPGDCRRLHGHNWKVEVEVLATALDNVGMGVDFREIKQATRLVTDQLDHRYLNEIPPFDQLNPTAENIAAVIFQRIGERLNSDRISVKAVTIWETDRACVRYSES